MVLLEMSVVPMGVGQSVSAYVAECVELIDRSGLPYEVNSMGTVIEGELGQVLAVLQQCVEHLARHSDRVTCSAKLDYRKGRSGRIRSKVESVERQLGRSLKNKPN